MTLELGHYTAHADTEITELAKQSHQEPLSAAWINARQGIKFWMPDVVETLRTLPVLEHLPEFKLPYPTITIEHRSSLGEPSIVTATTLRFGEIQINGFRRSADTWAPFPIDVFIWPTTTERGTYKIRSVLWHGSPDAPATIRRVAEEQLWIPVWSLVGALYCSNVVTEMITPSAALNKARQKRGRTPFDSYHILVLTPYEETPRVDLGGSHASPRQHLRRGHVRRLANGKTVWVNETIVGSAKTGTITKDYLLSR